MVKKEKDLKKQLKKQVVAPENTPANTPATEFGPGSSSTSFSNLGYVPNSDESTETTNSVADSVSLDVRPSDTPLSSFRQGIQEGRGIHERFDTESIGSFTGESPVVRKTPDSLNVMTSRDGSTFSQNGSEEQEEEDGEQKEEVEQEEAEPAAEQVDAEPAAEQVDAEPVVEQLNAAPEVLVVDGNINNAVVASVTQNPVVLSPKRRPRETWKKSNAMVSVSEVEETEETEQQDVTDTGSQKSDSQQSGSEKSDNLISFKQPLAVLSPGGTPSKTLKTNAVKTLLDKDSVDSDELPTFDRPDSLDAAETTSVGSKSKFDTQDQKTPDSLAAMTSLCGSPIESVLQPVPHPALHMAFSDVPIVSFSNPLYKSSSEEASPEEEKKVVDDTVDTASTSERKRPESLKVHKNAEDVRSVGSIGSSGSLLKDSPEEKDLPEGGSGSSLLAMKSLPGDDLTNENEKKDNVVLEYFSVEETFNLSAWCSKQVLKGVSVEEQIQNPLLTHLQALYKQSSDGSNPENIVLTTDNKMSDLFSGITESIKSTASAIIRNEHVRKVTESMNDAIMNYTKPEAAVREATNEDPWGPTGPQMKKIAEYTKSRYMEDYYNVFQPLFSRMLDNNKDAWRRVYKSLVLLDYLLKNGSERFVTEAREKSYELRRLESYKYTDEKGKDQGINIRHRVKLILEMLNDDDKLQAERSKATSDDKSKYRGYDQYDIKMSSSSSSSNFDKKWGNSSSSNDFGDYKRDTRDSREVSNFSFSSNSNTNNRSPSPELGFADEPKKKVEDDDGFGDFVSSRSSQPAATNKSTPNPTKPKTFFDAVPAIPPPSSSNYVAPPLSPVEKKAPSNFDLLGGFDDPTPAPTPAQNNSLDLFSLSTPVAAAPAPVPAATTPSADLFGFSAAPMAQTTPMAPASLNGGFQGFDFGPALGGSSFGGATPLQPATGVQQQQPKTVDLGGPAPKIGNSFAGLDSFMSLSLNPSSSATPKAKTLNQLRN